MEKIDRLGWAAETAFVSNGLRIGIRASSPEIMDRIAGVLPPHVGGPFNELPRLPFQLCECVLRMGHFITQVPTLVRQRALRPVGGSGTAPVAVPDRVSRSGRAGAREGRNTS